MADAQPKRTIGAKNKKIGAKGGGGAAPAPQAEAAPSHAAAASAAPPKKGKNLLMIGACALAVAGVGYFAYDTFLAPDDVAVAANGQPVTATQVAEVAPPELGPVLASEEPVSVNLANGRYLRLGYGLQLPVSEDEGGGGHGGGDEVHGPDVSRTRDIAITTFSGRQIEDVNDPAKREEMRAEFLTKLQEAFGEHEVLDVYFTDFVTQ